MAIFAATHIRAGSELRHSYLPPRLLILPRAVRTSHLHFACACPRCKYESMPTTTASSEALAAMGFPAGHALTKEGLEVASFKLVMGSSEHEAIINDGGQLLERCMHTLSTRPLAALEITAPILAAYFALKLSDHIPGGVPVKITKAMHGHARAAASLQAAAAERVRLHYVALDTAPNVLPPLHYASSCTHDVAGVARGARDAAELLADTTLVCWALLEPDLDEGENGADAEHGSGASSASADTAASPSRANSSTHASLQPPASWLHGATRGAMRRCAARFGWGLEWLRDDLPCFHSTPGTLAERGTPTPPALLVEVLATACPMDARPVSVLAVASAAGLALIAGPAADECEHGQRAERRCSHHGKVTKLEWTFCGRLQTGGAA